MSEPVLLVDDDDALRRPWARLLRAEGYSPLEAANADAALDQFSKNAVKLVVLDLMLPPSNTPDAGAAVLDAMLSSRPDTKVVVASGTGEVSLALSLVRRGAYDFIAKPVDPDVLIAVLARARARLTLEDRVRELERSLASSAEPSGLLGDAPAFLEARALAEKAAQSEVPLLLSGESGTGKDVFARFIHQCSRRSRKPFVAVNCGAISPQLLESTLFGHKKGAFTGATQDARGLFQEADGGTLFLDELGDLALDLQVKLLRALESGEVLPVGATRPTRVDVRIVSATHKPLSQMVAEKTFRDDLYWRIRGIEVHLPKLAERPGDVGVLAQHFLNQARSLTATHAVPKLSPEALRRLEEYGWPGNLRELRHEMQRAVVLCGGRAEILVEDLSPALRGPPLGSAVEAGEEGTTLEEKIAALERREIERALADCDGNKSHAAERLGLSRQGLLNKLARFGLR